MLHFNRNSGIIVACDVASREDFANILSSTSDIDGIVGYKVGFSLALRLSLRAVVKQIKGETGKPVIYDHQKAATDIPATGRLFAETCRDAEVDAAILFPQAGPRTEEAFISALVEASVTPIVGAVMTHAAYLTTDGGFIIPDAPEKIFDIAMRSGVRDFVLPGNQPQTISKLSSAIGNKINDPTFFMPGIGTQGGTYATALTAARPHRAFAIIGSAIYSSTDPRSAVGRFLEDATKAGEKQ